MYIGLYVIFFNHEVIMFIKLVRIGKDAELKQSNSGKSFLSLSVVYDIGYGENKTSQWTCLSWLGKAYLKGMLLSVEFVSSGKQDAPAQDSHNTQKSNGYQKQSQDLDDDLPFWCNKKAS